LRLCESSLFIQKTIDPPYHLFLAQIKQCIQLTRQNNPNKSKAETLPTKYPDAIPLSRGLTPSLKTK